MTKRALSTLYRELVLDHSQHPSHHHVLAEPTVSVEVVNPSCGDELTLMLKLDRGKICDIGFQGQGCAISVASASMMTEVMLGKTVQEAASLIKEFTKLIQGQGLSDERTQLALKDAIYLEGIQQFPARYKCCMLAWKACESCLIEEGFNE